MSNKKSNIDYSKWDKLSKEIEDSESEIEEQSSEEEEISEESDQEEEEKDEDVEKIASMLGKGGLEKMKANIPSNRGHLQFHPQDLGAGLLPVFYTNPHTFVPTINKASNIMLPWGINDVKTFAHISRKMQTQYLYVNSETPEVQWINVQKAKKEQELKAARELPDAEAKRGRDLILEVVMDKVKPQLWRQIRVSGNTSLNAFNDKILIPALGFVRNYHAYYFCDQKDGAVFMPKNSGSIDIMHIETHGIYKALDDVEYKLGELFDTKGRSFMYVYDLGDQFSFMITLSGLPPDKTGKVELLGGEMEGPPENSCGLPNSTNMGFQELLDMRKKDPANYKQALRTIWNEAQNYKERKKPYDPFTFDIEDARQRIKDALSSPASTQSGKTFSFPLRPGAPTPTGFFGREKQKGETVVISQDNEHPGRNMVETIRQGKDPKTIALCAQCGCPDHLKLCVGCKQTKYCSVECQKAHWKYHKEICKTLQKDDKKIKNIIS